MSRSRRFLDGLIFGYGYQAIVMVTGLWLTPFLLRHLGQHDYGLWLTALQITTYLMLADFGIVALLPRTVAYATGRAGGSQNANELPEIIGQTAEIVFGQTVLVATAAVMVWLFLPAEWLALRGPLAVIMGAFVLFFPLRMLPAILEGLQEQGFVVRANMAGWTISTVTSVLLILGGFRLYSIAAGWALSQLWAACICFYRLRSRHPHLLPSRIPYLPKSELFNRLSRGFWISANQVGTVLIAGSDVLIISKVLGPSLVVPYACTVKLATVLANQPQLFMHLATPGLSEMSTSTSKDQLYRVTIALSQGMLLLTGLLFCVILTVNGAFVHWWVGAQQYAGFPLTLLVLTAMVLSHWSLTFQYTLFSFGYERMLAICTFVNGLVTAGLMLSLVSRFGYIGVVTGSIVGISVTTLPIGIIALSRELGMPIPSMLKPFWPWFWRWILMAGACVLIARNWPPQSVMQIIVFGCVIGIVYCSVMLNPILQSPLGPHLRRLVEDVQSVWMRIMGTPFRADKQIDGKLP